MEAVIREYKVKAGQMERIVRLIGDQVAPLIQKIPGFVEYTIATPSDTQINSLSFFQDKAGADESTRAAAESVSLILRDVVEGEPRVSGGEVIIRQSDPKRRAHFGIMRRFVMTPKQVLTSMLRVREGLLPILASSPGFVAYSGIDCGNGTAISFGAFENQEMAAATVQRATAWFQQAIQHIPMPDSIPGDIKLRIVNEGAIAQA